MYKRIIELLLASVRSALFGQDFTEEQKALYLDDEAKQLFEVAKGHDLAHLLGLALVHNGLITKDHPLFSVCQKAQVVAVYRYEQLNFELQRVADLFEKAEIQFLPLKGSVLRHYYPEPWMRTSSDIDILVREADLERAMELLKTEFGYTEALKTRCDVAFNTPNGQHVELHFDLIDDRFANDAHLILQNVWDYASIKDGYKFWHVLSDDMFYYYHIAHMSKHFEQGGCGIRTFVDLFILDNMREVDKNKREELLARGNMLKFAQGSSALARVWFGGDEHNELTCCMEHYILNGGTFGSYQNRVTVQQQKKGGKKHYALSRIFPDKAFMKRNFTYTEKHGWLLPVAYVHRMFAILFKGNAASSLRELKTNSTVSSEQSDEARQMLDQLGLL